MKRRIRIRTILAASFLMVNLMGCLPMNDKQVISNAERIYSRLSEPTKQAPNEIASSSRRNLADEQDLKLSGRDITSVDPISAVQDGWLYSNQVFIGLTRLDPDSGEFDPAMAESWTVSDDLQTWTFDLNKKIPWVRYNSESGQVEKVQDGSGEERYVSSYDFKTGMLRVLDPQYLLANDYYLDTIQGASEYADQEGELFEVGIETPDIYQIIIRTNQPNPYLDALAEMPVFSAYPSWIEEDINEAQDLPAEVAFGYGYGPYVIKEYKEEDHIVLIKNPYWKGSDGVDEPILDEISFDLSSEQDVVAMYQAGDLDAVRLTLEEYLQVKDEAELADDILITPGSCGYYLFFNRISDGISASAESRQMVAAAIDKEDLNWNTFSGTAQVLNQFVPEFVRGGMAAEDGLGIAYDAEKADDYFGGLTLSATNTFWLHTLDRGPNAELMNGIIDNLDKVQAPTTMAISEDIIEYYTRLYIENGQETGFGNIVLAEYCMNYADAQTFWDAWQDPGLTSISRNWKVEEFTEFLDQSLTQEAISDRAGTYAAMEQIIIQEDAVVIPLAWSSNYWLRKPSLDGTLPSLYPQLEDWAFTK